MYKTLHTAFFFEQRMRNYLFIVACIGLLLISAAQAQSLDVRNTAAYYPGGGLKSKAEYYYDSWSEQEIKHGRYAEWDAQGNLSYEAFYVHGKLMGKSISYYNDGAPKAIEHSANGKLNGKCSYFYPNGKLKLVAHYLNGLSDATWKWYRRDGTLKRTKQYEQGKLINDAKASKTGHLDTFTPKF